MTHRTPPRLTNGRRCLARRRRLLQAVTMDPSADPTPSVSDYTGSGNTSGRA